MAQFSGKTVVITGAAGGIGAALCAVFAARGAQVIGLDLRPSQDVRYTLDLAQPEEIDAITAQICARHGADVLVNNAGLGVVGAAESFDPAAWDATMAINLRAPWLMARGLLPALKRSGAGRVVNIASQAGLIAIADHAAYGASKAGLINLTKVLALEWAGFGITVNAIAPTVVETPMALVGWAGEKGLRAKAEIPVGRFARPEEIAFAAAFLASEESAIITGETLVMDGGFTIR